MPPEGLLNLCDGGFCGLLFAYILAGSFKFFQMSPKRGRVSIIHTYASEEGQGKVRGSGCERVSSSRLRFDGQGGGLKQRKWRWEGAGCRTALGRSAGKKAVRAYRCGRRTPWQLGSPPLPFAHRGGKNKFWGLGRRPLSGAKSDNWWGKCA